MPRRTNTNTKSSSKSKSKSRKLRRTNSKLNSKTNSKNKNSYKNSYKSKRSKSRKYRGGCKNCANSPPGTWTSTGPMHGGANPEQISKDIYTHVTNSISHSVA